MMFVDNDFFAFAGFRGISITMGKKKKISEYIKQVADSQKVIVFTVARQTEKTTLEKDFFHGYTYISIEATVM